MRNGVENGSSGSIAGALDTDRRGNRVNSVMAKPESLPQIEAYLAFFFREILFPFGVVLAAFYLGYIALILLMTLKAK